MRLFLDRLSEGYPALRPALGQTLAEAAAVCLEEQGHALEAKLHLKGSHTNSVILARPDVLEQMRRSFNDPEEATEFGACAIAIILIHALEGLAVVERSRKGTGFDYWLGHESDLPFQNKARLEVSGIRQGTEASINARVKQKIEQTKSSDGIFPAFVVVVEFSRPLAQVVKR